MPQVILRLFVVICTILLFCGHSSQAADPVDSTLFVLSHVTAQPGETISLPFSINTVHDNGGYNFLFSHTIDALEAIELSSDGTRSEGVETFFCELVNSSPQEITGIALFYLDYIPAGGGPVANLIMNVNQSLPYGCLLPLTIFNEAGGYGSRVNGMAGQNGCCSYFPDFNNGSILIPLDTSGEWHNPGDVNANDIDYEIADAVLMSIQLSEGIESYMDETLQAWNSDVNFDLLPWTIADYILVVDVAAGHLVPPWEETITEVIHMPGDSIWFDAYEGSPVDTLEIPIYAANSIRAGGLSFKLNYSLTELEFVSYSLDGTRLPSDWTQVSAVERSDGLMFFATTDIGNSPQGHKMPTGDGLLVTLKFAVHTVISNILDVHFERLQHHGQVNGYATYDWPYWHFASFQNVDKAMYFSYIIGDANGSEFIDIDDVVYLIQFVFGGGPAPLINDAGDFNRDSIIDSFDVIALLHFIFG